MEQEIVQTTADAYANSDSCNLFSLASCTAFVEICDEQFFRFMCIYLFLYSSRPLPPPPP
jgi:hypothetical protein